MRLAGITHLGVRSDSFESRNTRLVVYVAPQARPVYASEARVVSPHSVTEYAKVDFSASPFEREFRIAIQMWVYTNRWVPSDEWVIDLRELRPVGGEPAGEALPAASSGVVVYSHNTEMALPLAEPYDVESAFPSSPKPRESLPTRLFKWYRGEPLADGVAGSADGECALSLSYPQLVDLWTLENSLAQSLSSSRALSADVDALIDKSLVFCEIQKNALGRKLRALQAGANQMRVQTRALVERAAALQKERADARERVERSLKPVLQPSPPPHTDLTGAIRSEQARLAKELLAIFPIEPVDDHNFVFAICGIVLPSVFAINHYDPVQVGAALGFVAQVVVCLSRYLDVPLTYPVTLLGSQSYISDNISVIKHGSTQFPLWTRGALLYRVEYALYLLHKNIEKLMNSMNLAVIDLKQTLANLKNLLLVVSTK